MWRGMKYFPLSAVVFVVKGAPAPVYSSGPVPQAIMRTPYNEIPTLFGTSIIKIINSFLQNVPNILYTQTENDHFWPSMKELTRQSYIHIVAENLSYNMNIGLSGKFLHLRVQMVDSLSVCTLKISKMKFSFWTFLGQSKNWFIWGQFFYREGTSPGDV